MTIPSEENLENENETVVRMRSAEEKGFWHNLRKYFREYSEVTGIHGLRYVTEKRSRTEKIVWGFLLILSLGGCIYMIYEIIYKYENSPVVVSFATEETPLYQIPFPAVTICPEMKYSIFKFNYTKVFLQLYEKEKVNKTELKNFFHLSLLCTESEFVDKLANDTVDESFFRTIDELKLEKDLMFLGCSYGGKTQECRELLVPVITDEGICYSFNILGREDVFRDHVFHFARYYDAPEQSKDVFDLETGYSQTTGADTYPRRAMLSGGEYGLRLFIKQDVEEVDYFCSGFLKGYKVLIHNPWDFPVVSKDFITIPTGKMVLAALEPELIMTSESVRKFAPEKRKCFMKNEKLLKHFKDYTQSNCLFECLTNYTLSQCGCVPFYMPRTKETAICGRSANISDCLEKAENNLRLKEIESKIAGVSYCDCKPGCTSLKYNVETSRSNLYFEEYFGPHPEHRLELGFAHWTVLQIYFKSEQIKTLERSELYGTSDLISNLGGLLGLFTGFSLISLVEIIYFCSLRLFYNERLYGIWSGPPS